MRLGYACINTELSLERIFTNRTMRMSTIEEKGVDGLIELAERNLSDLIKILEWNEENNIFLYRMSSMLLPHISNHRIKGEYKLLYDIKMFADQFREVGTFNHRLTFHPDPFVVINSKSKSIVKQSILELSWHAKALDLIDGGDFRPNNIIILHGGGVYGDLPSSKARWIKAYLKLPTYIQRRIVLENDETKYSLDDVIDIHNKLRKLGKILPIVLDWFHFKCYYGHEYDGRHFDKILSSWHDGGRTPKMHVSDQLIGARFGSHSDFITEKTFRYLLRKIKELKAGRTIDLDLMIEAKMKEQAVLKLISKFKL